MLGPRTATTIIMVPLRTSPIAGQVAACATFTRDPTVVVVSYSSKPLREATVFKLMELSLLHATMACKKSGIKRDMGSLKLLLALM